VSRIGKKPVEIPKGVQVKLDQNRLSVKGVKGELNLDIHSNLKASVVDNKITLENASSTRESKAIFGLMRSIVANMVAGVTQGYERKLKIEGVGYKAELKDRKLFLSVGFFRPVEIPVPNEITLKVETPQIVSVSGIDKQLVGNLAATIRKTKPAEPYNGKGIFYIDEKVRRKAGKSGK